MISPVSQYKPRKVAKTRLNELLPPLAKYLNSHPKSQQEFIATILAARGITPEELPTIYAPKINRILPNPSELPNIQKAIDLLQQAITQNNKIAIISDWDADGATSAALLGRFLTHTDTEFFLQIPSRLKNGYGPATEHIDTLHQQGIGILITADCGTTSHLVMEHARKLGIRTIVIDHHQPHRQDARIDALVNPMLLPAKENHPLKALAAAGVVFLVLVGLNRQLRQNGFYKTKPEPNLYQLLDLVAIATICDIMPMTPLNRVLIKCGLKVLSKWNTHGLKALAAVAEIPINKPPDAKTVGFALGPRLNAGGRVGDSSLASRLLLTEDADEARAIADVLDQHNKKRKQLETKALEFANLQAENKQHNPALVVKGDWHVGIVGLVAGRIAEQWQKPTFAIARRPDGLAQGSARGAGKADVGAMASQAVLKGLAMAGGGHAGAAGFTTFIAKLGAFERFIVHNIQTTTKPLVYDIAITPQRLIQYSDALARLAPFGEGFETPLFLLENLAIQDMAVKNHLAHLSLVKVGEKKVRAMARGNYLIQTLLKAKDTPSLINVIASLETSSYGNRLIVKEAELTAKPK